VYGGHLSAVLLPDKVPVQVPARQAYQPYGKSRSHRMYAWTKVRRALLDSPEPFFLVPHGGCSCCTDAQDNETVGVSSSSQDLDRLEGMDLPQVPATASRRTVPC